MKMTRTLAVVLLLAGATIAAADFDLSWNTIDGGGALFTTGGAFELSGTIGQPDAGSATGGGWSLTGGFWNAGLAAPCGGTTRGDSNCDGGVDFDDIDCFVAALIDEGAWQVCAGNGGCDFRCANDINQDQSVDFNDIDGFVACMVNGGCP